MATEQNQYHALGAVYQAAFEVEKEKIELGYNWHATYDRLRRAMDAAKSAGVPDWKARQAIAMACDGLPFTWAFQIDHANI